MKKTELTTRSGLLVLLLGIALFGVASVRPAYAATISLSPLPDLVNYHDFVVGPGKIELTLNPGQSATVDLTVANRLGSDKVFSITEEDFTGSQDPSNPIVLLGSDRGPYSLKDDIHIPASTTLIPFGQKAFIPITVSVPMDAQPGALYGSVLVSVVSAPGTTTSQGIGATNPIITRIGTLFFVRIPGPVQAEGSLAGFSLPHGSVIWSNSLSKSPPIAFDLLFKNTGDVYLAPSGTITITNIMGSTIASIPVDPWFAMPQSLRFREVTWSPEFVFGRYVAHLTMDRGYASTTDQADVVFWVIPWTLILIALLGLVIVVWLIRFVATRFKIVSKR